MAHGGSLKQVLEESFSPWVSLGEILGGERVGSWNSDGLWGVGGTVVWGKQQHLWGGLEHPQTTEDSWESVVLGLLKVS